MGKREDVIKQIIELRGKGYSFSEIARKLGLSKTTVWRYYREWEERNRKVTTTSVVTSRTGVKTEIVSLELIQSILENVRALEKSLDDVNRRLKIVEDRINTIYDISKLRVEGRLKCKYVDDYGYCTKILLDKCVSSLDCVEVVLDEGVKTYRVKVTSNPIICLVCPYYTPRRRC